MIRNVLAVLCLSSALHAQLSGKQAVAQLKGDLKDGFKEFKQAVATAAQAFDANLDTTDDLLVAGATISSFVGNLAGSAQTVQEAVRTAIEEAYDHAADDLASALEALDPAIDLTLGYPEAFVPGAGGPLDDFEADVRRSVAKTYVKLNKRLGKSAGAAEKQGVGLSVRLVPPVDAFGYNAAAGDKLLDPSTPVRIDAVVAASLLAEDDDGVLTIMGIAMAGGADVTIDLFSVAAGSDQVAASVIQGSDRWAASITDYDGSGGLPEVGYTIVANQCGEGSATSVPFGVR